MKKLTVIIFFLHWLTDQAYGQKNAKDTVTIFKNMKLSLCSCYSSSKAKPTITIDSCTKKLTLKYQDSLKNLGFDLNTERGAVKFANEVYNRLDSVCPYMYNTFMDKYRKEIAEKIVFYGRIVSQKKLSDSKFEIVMLDPTTGTTRTFYNTSFLSDPKNKYTLQYSYSFEYQERLNTRTKSIEFHIKENTVSFSIDVPKTANK